MTRYCPNCFVGIDPEDEFCKNCGEPLSPTVPESSSEHKINLPTDSLVPVNDEPASDESAANAFDEANFSDLTDTTDISQSMNPSEGSPDEVEAKEGHPEAPSQSEAEASAYQASNAFEKDTPPEEPVLSASADQQTEKPKKPVTDQDDIISLGEWMWSLLLTFIPIVNIVALIVWSVSETTNPNKKNFARARLIYAGIGIIFWIIALIILVVSAATIGATGYYYY